jgi:ABC-type branched-subunit amino acid transport system permease subunit
MKLSKNWGYLSAILLTFVIPVFIKSDYYIHIFILSVINIILTSSLRTIAITGQVSMGHAGFKCIGAYTSAIIAMKLGFSPYLSMLMGGLAAMGVAGIIAYPITRVKTVYFSMLTMFFGIVITLLTSEWRSLTGGTTGILDIPSFGTATVLGIGIDFNSKLPNLYLALILMFIVLFFLYGLDRSYIGMTLKAIAQDDSLAASTGINVARYKAIIFCIGCFIAGLAGSFYAHYWGILNPDSFSLFHSIYLLIYMIVGGTDKFVGAVIGAFILTLLPEVSRVFQEYQPLVFVAVLYLVVFLLPKGLVELPQQIKPLIRIFYRGKVKPHAGN